MKSNSYQKHIIAVSIIICIFIYNRKLDYYKVIPRKNLFIAVCIGLWTYISFTYNVWFVIIGLVILNMLDQIL